LFEDHHGDNGLVSPEFTPAHGDVDQRRVEQRGLDLLVLFLDEQPIQPIGAAPPGQVDICDLASVIAHVGHLVVQVVAHQMGQGRVQHDQEGGQRKQNPQRQSVAAFHLVPVRSWLTGWTRTCAREFGWTRHASAHRL